MSGSRGVARRLGSVCVAALVAAPIVVGAGAGPAEAAGVPLYPDLKTLPARELRFDRADITPELSGNFHNVLRFSNDTNNVGDGPLILNAQIDPSTLQGPASQRVMNSDGTFTDIPLGTNMYWHAAHRHYHFDNWGDYQLWTKSTYDAWIASGRTTGAPIYSGAKQTSCVTDEEFITSVPANAVYPGPYGTGGCDVNGQNQIHMGLSVGWGDTYDWYRQLQWIDLGQDTLGNGTYVLRSVADPLNFVYESANKADPAREGVAGNEATTNFVVSGGVIQDSDAPTGTVSINHVDKTTASATVNVDVVGRDDVSEPNQFRLSNDGVTFKTFNYTSSGSFPTTVSWNLTDAAAGGTAAGGVKTVYAQVHDNNGKWGPTFTDTIDLQTGGGPPPPPPPSGAYGQQVVGDNPSGYWRLNETSGTTANDSAGSNPGTYHGVALGAASLLVGDGDLAAQFPGANQYVSVASTAPISPANAMSAEAWIKPASLPASGAFASIVSKTSSYVLQFNGPQLEFTILQAGVPRRLQAPAGAVVAGGTYHVVGTYDGTTQRLYINGSLAASAPLTGAIDVNANALNFGSLNGSTEFFNGTIDEVAVFPVALSGTQVANHYQAGTNPPQPQVHAQLSIARSGAGNGVVTSTPAGIACGATCSASFPVGTSMALTAAPKPGSVFTGWSGGSCHGTASCTFMLEANTNITASFSPAAKLTISKHGHGTVTSTPRGIACGSTCSTPFKIGSVVRIDAVAKPGSRFTGWSGGGCHGRGACKFTLKARVTVSATFKRRHAASHAAATRTLTRDISIGGTTPIAPAFDDALGRAYVTRTEGRGMAATNGVTVIDVRARRVVGYITTGGSGPSAIAVNPLTHRVYVTTAVFDPSGVRGSIAVIDGRTNKIIRTIATGPGPKAVAVNPITNRVYVTEQTGTNGGAAIAVIDGASNHVIATVPVGPYGRYYDNPFGLAVNAETNTVYATNPLQGTVYALDGATNTIARSVAVGGEPTAIAVDSGTGNVYVAGSRNMTVLRGRTGVVTKSFAIAGRPRAIAIDAPRHLLYATTNLGELIAFDTRTFTATGVTWDGPELYGIAITGALRIVASNAVNANVSLFGDTG